jgi:hypothetical protein
MILAVPASAADRIEMVVRSMKSDNGLLGNAVCRLFVTVKNGTGNRLDALEYSLSFPGLTKPARGGTGFQFLSPDSVGSDSEAQFVATWHEGGCQREHAAKPVLTVDVCAIRGMSERDCKALLDLRSKMAPAIATGGAVKPEEAEAIREVMREMVDKINAKQLPLDARKTEGAVDTCIQEFKRNPTEKQAMACTLLMVVFADWMTKASSANGKLAPGFTRPDAIDRRMTEIFDALGLDPSTRADRLRSWQRDARDLSAKIALH